MPSKTGMLHLCSIPESVPAVDCVTDVFVEDAETQEPSVVFPLAALTSTQVCGGGGSRLRVGGSFPAAAWAPACAGLLQRPPAHARVCRRVPAGPEAAVPCPEGIIYPATEAGVAFCAQDDILASATVFSTCDSQCRCPLTYQCGQDMLAGAVTCSRTVSRGFSLQHLSSCPC